MPAVPHRARRASPCLTVPDRARRCLPVPADIFEALRACLPSRLPIDSTCRDGPAKRSNIDTMPVLKLPTVQSVRYPREWQGLPQKEILRRLAHMRELETIRVRYTGAPRRR